MSKFRDTRLYEALDYLDEAYVAEVVENLKVPPAPGMPTRKRGQLRYILALAACLLVLSAAIPVITYVLRNYTEFPGWLVGETTADTSPELTEPETPPEVTTAPPAPETSENIYHETTAPLYDGTTAKPEPEYDGSRGLLYQMNEDGKSYYLAGMGICTDEDIVVASTYDGYPVTIIGEDALAGYDRVKSITIPDSVTAIDMRAFKDCTELESITIPDTVYYISGNAFMNCTSLKSIKLPKALELVNPSVFGGCTALEEIVVPDFVTEIYIMAFYKCTNLKSVTLGRRVEKLWADVFRDCENLTEINFAGTMARWNVIEKDDEWNFGSVITVVHCIDGDIKIEPDVTTEPEYDGSVGLEYEISDDGKYAILVGIGTCTDTDIVIATTYMGYPVKYIGWGAFEKNADIKSVVIPEGIEIIVQNAFRECSALVSVTLPDSVKSIGERAFAYCSSLTDVKLSSSLELLDERTFAYCSALKSIDIPESVTHIEESVFEGCSGISELYIPKNVTYIDVSNFRDVGKFTIDPENPKYSSAGNCFIDKETKTLLKMYANSVLPNDGSIEIIGRVAIDEYLPIKELILPEGVRYICEGSLTAMETLEYLHLPSTFDEYEQNSFSHFLSLKKITMADGNPKYYVKGNCLIERASGTVILGTSESTIPSDGSVKHIGPAAFAGNKNLTSIVIHEGVVSIQVNAFAGCSSLNKVTLPQSLERVGTCAFFRCALLKSIELGDNVKYIESEAFAGCKGLTDLVYSGTVREWKDIQKGSGWNAGASTTRIKCSDGEVSLSMLTEEEAIESARKHWGLDSSSIIIVKDDPSVDSPLYMIAHCEYAQSVGEFEIKREVYVDQNTGECSEVVYDYPNIPEVFLDVIFNREKFLYVEQTTDSSGEYKYTTSEALFKDHSVHHENVFGVQDLWYYVTDIDGDSISELIFPGSARSNYGMLFRVYEGKIYGYACILDGLRTDATYLWHEQAGNYRGRSQVYFDGIFYKSRRLTEYDTNDPNNIIYYVEGKETTKEKYEEYESAFSDEELESFQLDYYPVYVNPYPGG